MKDDAALYPPLLPPKGAARAVVIGFLILAPLLYGWLGVYQGQEIGFDFRQYHWYNAFALVTGRYFSHKDFLPSGVQFFINPLLDVPFYELATHWSLKGAVFVRGVFQGMNAWALFFLAYLVLPIENVKEKTVVSLVAAIVGMSGAMMIAEAGASFDDNIVALFILFPMVFLLRGAGAFAVLPCRTALFKVFLIGVPAGLMTGLKLTAGGFCVGLCVSLLLATKDFKRNVALSFFFGLGVLAGFAATYGFWGYYLYTNYDNPFFPFLNSVFKSPYFAPVEFVQDYTAYKGSVLLYPFAFTFGDTHIIEAVWWDFRFVSFYILFWMATLKMCTVSFMRVAQSKNDDEDRPIVIMAFTMAIVSYVIWVLVYRTYRYLLPLEMLSPLLSFVCLHYLLPELKKTKIVLGIMLVCFVLVCVNIPIYGRKARWTPVTSLTAFTLPKEKPLMILMGGISGYAHTLMAFPPESSFVRLDGTLFVVDKPVNWLKVSDLTQKKIDTYAGTFLWYAPKEMRPRRAAILKAYGLAIKGTCQVVTDKMVESAHNVNWRFMPRWFDLCPVVRIDTKAKH